MWNFKDAESVMARLRASGAIATEAPREPDLNDTHLNGVQCNICGNKGYVLIKEAGIEYAKVCVCMASRRAMFNARKSNMSGLFDKYTFKKFTTPNEQYKQIKEKAKEYIDYGSGKWFFVSGIPGSGKTHICTAICAGLLKKGHHVKYVIWRDVARDLKVKINDPEYNEIMDSLKRPGCLYIDDFMKGSITDADINRAIEIINARYNMPGKRTIISTELDIKDIRKIDEAVGGRIYERAKGYCFKSPNVNWRN